MRAYRGRLQGYLLGRAAVLAALLAFAALSARRGGLSLSPTGLSTLTATSFGVTLASALALRAGRWLGAVARLQPAWDVGCVTALVYLSGGAFSPFVILYPLAIIGGAILLFRKGALVTAAAACLAYGLLVALQLYGLLRPPGGAPLSHELAARLLPHLVAHTAAFFVLALLAGYLAEELRRTDERLEVARAEMLDLERLQESILRSLSSGLVALDADGREVFHNRAAEELLGRAGVPLGPGSLLGQTFDLSGGDRREAVLGGGTTVLGYTASPLAVGADRRGSILIFQDLTRVKRLEDDLRRADRLAAVGRLAAGLAHEIRNPLASLAGSVEVLRETLAPGDDEARLFAIVLRETERLNRLVTNFLHYARPGRADEAPLELRAAVAEAALFFGQGEGREGFALENRVPGGLELRADASQLQQLFLNLFRNSREAAPAGVAVAVEARVDGPWVELTVADDGPGMTAEVAERAFEPFFSGRDGGTGLGLATVHRIVENHGGTVALDTGAEQGTRFRIRLPRQGLPAAGRTGLRS